MACSRQHPTATGLLLALLLAVLAPCVAVAKAVSAQAPQHLRIGNGNEPETLDPHRSEGVSSANIVRDLYEGLTGFSPTGQVVPAAAERWEVSADGLRYVFQLRRNALWSNGDTVVAADFVAGLQRSIDPATGSAFAQMLLPIAGAEAVLKKQRPATTLAVQALDDHRLEIRLAAPTPYLLGLLTHASTFPIHRASLALHGKHFARPGTLISNGAYQLLEWREQARVRLARNPHYWNHAATRIALVDYHPTEDSGTELARYRADELDITAEIPVQQAPWIRAQFSSELRIAPYLGSYYYGINVSKPPFAGNAKLRLALSLAVDREVIVNKVMHGVALPAYSYVPPGVLDYSPQRPQWAGWSRAQRLALARKLYAEAGYSAKKPLKLQLRFNTNEGHRRIAVVVAAMWKQWLGVQTELINEEFKVFINNRNLRQVTQIFRSSWIADYNDASSFTDILHSTHGQNDSGWQAPAYDALLAQAAQEADASRRRALLEQAERMVLAETPVLPIYTYVSKHLVKPWVQGWQDNPMDYHYSKDLSLAARAR